jgi:diacylglycerol O-acyltransferase / wax synthase
MIAAPADNRLAFMDQASYLGLRATGQGQECQVTWVYNRAVDLDRLQRFSDNLAKGGLFGRRIERSPLPFGRHRWVTYAQSPVLDIAPARPRAELPAWLDQRGHRPIDPEYGPPWHLGVLPFTEGGAAVTLVVSHTLVDGLGLSQAIADAVNEATRDFGYPCPRSRERHRAVRQDAGSTMRDIPEVVGALRAAAKVAWRDRHELAKPRVPAPIYRIEIGGDQRLVVPSVTVHVDQSAWDDRVNLLGGTSNALFAAYSAKFAQRAGRVTNAGDGENGTVTLSFPVSDRVTGDTRGNALSSIDVKVDPEPVTTDLTDIRRIIKSALTEHQSAPNEFLPLLPLTPFVPKRAAMGLAGAAFSYEQLPVGASNLGPMDPAIGRIDGADADYVSVRLVEQGVTRGHFERIGGQLMFVSGRIVDKVFITVVGYQIGVANSRQRLHDLAVQTLKDFDLTGTIS